jgi:hypothetical protein
MGTRLTAMISRGFVAQYSMTTLVLAWSAWDTKKVLEHTDARHLAQHAITQDILDRMDRQAEARDRDLRGRLDRRAEDTP